MSRRFPPNESPSRPDGALLERGRCGCPDTDDSDDVILSTLSAQSIPTFSPPLRPPGDHFPARFPDSPSTLNGNLRSQVVTGVTACRQTLMSSGGQPPAPLVNSNREPESTPLSGSIMRIDGQRAGGGGQPAGLNGPSGNVHRPLGRSVPLKRESRVLQRYLMRLKKSHGITRFLLSYLPLVFGENRRKYSW
jgi:hypothetical protein